MKSLHILCWIGCCLILLGATGCRGSNSSKPRVAFVTNNPDPFWKIAEAGAKKAATESDVELFFRMPSPGSVTTQKEEIDTVLNQGVKAIAVSVIDPKNQSDYLDEIASKASLLTQDNDAPKSKRLAYIGTDNYQAGRAAGKLVKEALGEEGGIVVIFVGTLESLNARQRRQGVIDEVADKPPLQDVIDFKPSPDGEKFGKYELFEKTYLDQPEGAARSKQNAEDALTKLPADRNVCLVGLWAYNPPTILTAVTDQVKDPERRKKVKIVAFDENPATLDGIKEGSIYATVVQDPYNFGYESVKMMAALAKGDKSGLPKDGMHHIPYRIVAQEAGEKNGMKRLAVEPFRVELNKLLGK
jgi:ribose transport system substrate-binding protein